MSPASLEKDPDFERLLEFMKSNRGFDFTGYKRASLGRRIGKRMAEIDIDSPGAYIDHLEANPGEFASLFNTVLINVTGFFRDTDTWAYLQKEIVPKLNGGDAPIRVWIPGCASGEEAYTAAIVIAEALGPDKFSDRVKIYGTDVDEDALVLARHGSYPDGDLEPVPDELRGRYFEHNSRNGNRLSFRKDLRRSVIFGRNDLVSDAPIPRIDLLLCRNTLMYFNPGTQAGVLERFHFALKDDGYLCLGRSEMLIRSDGDFDAVELEHRVYRAVPREAVRERLVPIVPAGDGAGAPAEMQERMRHGAFDQAPVAQLVIDREGRLVLANQQARALFDVRPSDAGRPLKDLSVAHRPVDLQAGIASSYAERTVVDLGPADWTAVSGEQRKLHARVAPVTGPDAGTLGVTVIYTDVTSYGNLQDELERSAHELENAYEELQSTVEELETTNEELQSTNEELETTNEELHSASDELEAINSELNVRTGELERVNGFMESILTSLGLVVVALTDNQTVQLWNVGAEEMWGMRADEAEGKRFMDLDIGLPVAELKPQIRACLTGVSEHEETVIAAVNRRGKSIECKVTCVSLRTNGSTDATGVILLMEASEAKAS